MMKRSRPIRALNIALLATAGLVTLAVLPPTRIHAANVAMTVYQPPAITSANGTRFTYGSAGSLTVASTVYPPATLTKNGTLSGAITVTDNAFDRPKSVSLTGTGVTAPYTVSPTSLAFGSEPTNVASAPLLITVTNTGNVALPITSITLSGTNPGQF